MGWTQSATIIGAFAAVIVLQSFWIARLLDSLREEMHRGFNRLDARIDRVEARLDRVAARLVRIVGGEPPSLRQV